MPNYTKNYNLKKPLQDEFYNIDDHNGNMDIVDNELKKRAELDPATGKVYKHQMPDISSVRTYHVTIGTNWTEDVNTGVKHQTIALDGVTAEHFAKVDTVNTHTRNIEGYALYVEEVNQFLNYIANGDAETVDGGIKFYIFDDANTVNIPIVVEVVTVVQGG
jgi:hypothetical protein